jgi:adenosylhomocysteine nucleosidase
MTGRLTLALSLILAAALAGCEDTALREEVTSYLVVMSAFPPELTKLLGEADIRDTLAVGEQTCYVGVLAGNDVILLLSGIGLDRAEATTRAVLDSFSVSGLIFSGIAGGINPNLSIGDVTVPMRWGHADGDLGPTDDGFWLPVDEAMLEAAGDVLELVALVDSTPDGVRLEHKPEIIVGGNGVSNSFFVDDREYREWLWTEFEANAVDMETAAVARAARDSNVPYIAFRSLSDLAGGGPGANEVDTFFQLAADNAAAVVLAFLEAWAARCERACLLRLFGAV